MIEYLKNRQWDLVRRELENYISRARYGVGRADTFNLDVHIARVIVEGLNYFPEGELEDPKMREMYDGFKFYVDAADNGQFLDDVDRERVLKSLRILRKEFFGLWF